MPKTSPRHHNGGGGLCVFFFVSGRAINGHIVYMTAIFLILFIGAAVCFAIAAANQPSRINLMALGLLLWVLVYVITYIDKLA